MPKHFFKKPHKPYIPKGPDLSFRQKPKRKKCKRKNRKNRDQAPQSHSKIFERDYQVPPTYIPNSFYTSVNVRAGFGQRSPSRKSQYIALLMMTMLVACNSQDAGLTQSLGYCPMPKGNSSPELFALELHAIYSLHHHYQTRHASFKSIRGTDRKIRCQSHKAPVKAPILSVNKIPDCQEKRVGVSSGKSCALFGEQYMMKAIDVPKSESRYQRQLDYIKSIHNNLFLRAININVPSIGLILEKDGTYVHEGKIYPAQVYLGSKYIEDFQSQSELERAITRRYARQFRRHVDTDHYQSYYQAEMVRAIGGQRALASLAVTGTFMYDVITNSCYARIKISCS